MIRHIQNTDLKGLVMFWCEKENRWCSVWSCDRKECEFDEFLALPVDNAEVEESEEKQMNKVILMGRLTRDPEIRVSVATNITTAKFTLAVDRKYKKEGEQQTADFISCTAFGKTAESIERYLHQGTKIVVVGRIQTGSYTNKDGNKVYTTDVVVEEYEFAESKNTNGSNTAPSSRPQAAVPNDGFMNLPLGVEDEGLPFN